ncbi:MAG: sulfatase [Planctomycetes bacterium]|nr:sulfatase [Planctomycetota bacterium]
MNLRCVIAAALLGLCAACDAQPAHPSLLVIVLDTVREDHVSAYGYPRRTTPAVDALAAQADRYENARSTAPWTLPSHASLFTGRFPHEHGAEARKTVDGQFFDAWPLSDEQLTLAEALESEGYSTAAFAANAGYVTERYGLSQGFQQFTSKRMRGDEVVDRALDWIGSGGRPFFVFLNLMDAHRKYNVEAVADAAARNLPAPPDLDAGQLLDLLCVSVLETAEAPSPELVQRVQDAYDLGIANADLALGRLFDELRARGLFDDTVIVVTADHGEYFGEHDVVEHSKDVYEPGLCIPLIVKHARQSAGRVIDAPTSIADVPRIVLGSMPAPLAALAKQFPGSSADRGLLAELRYTRQKDMSASYGKRFDRERSVLYVGSWKLIRSSDGQHELYDLASDPKELRNVFESRPEVSAKLMARLHALTLQRRTFEGDPIPPPLTADELRTLRETGYAGDVDALK